jgi:hypothetical protein
MYDLNLLDETFIRNLTHQYQLSIQTSLNGLSFSILDLQKLKYIVFRNYPFSSIQNKQEISEYMNLCFKNDDLLTLPYKHINFMYVGERSTLVPSEFFDTKNAESIFKFNYRLDEDSLVFYNQLTPSNIFNVFGIPGNLYKSVTKLFGQINVYHHATSFVRLLVEDSEKSTQPKFYVYLSSELINIGIALKGKLLYFNTFSYQNNTDILYYILSVLEQYKLSPKDTEVYFSSAIEEHDALFEFLNDYLNQIRFIKPSANYTYSYLFDELHLTRYANLFNLALCV